MELTDKQQRFIDEYLIDLNATQAAIRAGYSAKTAGSQAHDLLKKPEILARVRERQAEQAERLCLSADAVIIRLMDVYEKCMAALPVMVWDYEQRCKVESGEYMFDSKGALRALELIGNHLNMFKTQVQLGGTLEVEQNKLNNIIEQLRGPKDG